MFICTLCTSWFISYTTIIPPYFYSTRIQVNVCVCVSCNVVYISADYILLQYMTMDLTGSFLCFNSHPQIGCPESHGPCIQLRVHGNRFVPCSSSFQTITLLLAIPHYGVLCGVQLHLLWIRRNGQVRSTLRLSSFGLARAKKNSSIFSVWTSVCSHSPLCSVVPFPHS